MTGLGLIFLPICLWFWRSPARQLELVFIGSVFAAAAAVVLGGYGVTPGLVPAAMFIGLFMLKMVLGERYPAERIALQVMLPFILVVAGALISSILLPRLFEGEILVWPQKLSGFFVITPLAPNSGNYTQDMYLLINALLLVMAGIYLTREGFDLRRLLNTYFFSNLLVVAISLWQFAGNTVHVWFPTDFFLSNPGWALLSNESIGSLIRISGPFSEPAALATYMCGAVGAAAWVLANGDRTLLPRLVLGSGLLIILLCTSTTGYIALVIMAALLSAYTVARGSAALRKRVTIGLAWTAILGVICVVTVPVVAPVAAQDAVAVFNGTMNKQQSSSYNDRTSTDRDSVKEMFESDGLGVGWGSNRSSSLGPGLCASVGVWGIMGLIWFGWRIAGHVKRAQREAGDSAPRLVMHGCTGAIIGTISAAVLSSPSITSPDFYLLVALLIAAGARVRHEARLAAGVARLAPRPRPRTAYEPSELSEG
jgi:hypothetical protein